ncbi:hypothetical protein KO498_13080 [Lentibacter algarum]|uniref:hypothetical protein n=1 Tax=Lentibacter algarum TaxID=576131 RepID=UPI001C091856|nr:hypothetical protein [Lentibacter algarum]MBU2982743.1 hypothetical protein [Lentibacter algarum]
MNELTPDVAAMQIAQSVAALKQEMGALTIDLCALRERLKAGDKLAGVTAQLEDVTQWITIAQEMEHRFETDSRHSSRADARHAELDLDAARADIGRKLDRLRAAGCPESVS